MFACTPAELLEIINQHFKKLETATTSNQEQDVHNVWRGLFNELHAVVARLHYLHNHPCFQVKGTSRMDCLKQPMGSLFQELQAAVARLYNHPCHPCFQVKDTSKMSYLKNPTAKVDFTFTSGSKVGIKSKTLLGLLQCVLLV